MVVMFILDVCFFIYSLSLCRWGWCGNALAWVLVSIAIELVGAVIAHRLRHGHHSHVLIKI